MGVLDVCDGAGLVCFPGTHSKWIHLSDRTIVSFITCMTGEVFAVLRKCTILARIMTSDVSRGQRSFPSRSYAFGGQWRPASPYLQRQDSGFDGPIERSSSRIVSFGSVDWA